MNLPTISAADLPRLAYSHHKDHDPVLTEPEKFRRVINSPAFVKPEGGGLWTSPVTAAADTEEGEILGTAWTDWCRSENYGTEHYTDFLEIAPVSAFHGLIVDGVVDLAAIHAEYGMPLESAADWAVLDWERMALDRVDAVYLTDRGQAETRFGRPSFYDWDCASVLWLNPSYRVVS